MVRLQTSEKSPVVGRVCELKDEIASQADIEAVDANSTNNFQKPFQGSNDFGGLRDVDNLEDEGAKYNIFRGNWGMMGQAILASIAINFLGLAIPLFTMNVYDRVLPNGATTTLIALAIGAGLAVLFDFALKTLRALLIDTAARRADVGLSTKLMSRLLGARLGGQCKPVGMQMNSVRELETVREFYTSATLTALGDFPFAILFILVIFMVGGSLALVPIIAIPLVLGLVLLAQIPLGRLMDKAFQTMANKSTILAELLGGIETVKAIGAEEWAARRWEKSVADQLKLSTTIKLFSGLAMNIASVGQGLAVIAVIIMGAQLVFAGEITAGAVIASVMLLSRAMAPIAQIAGLAGRIQQLKLSHKALGEIIQAPQENGSGSKKIKITDFEGRIEFEQVLFRYEAEGSAILDDISLTIKPGERVAILGAMGSGKSTLLKMIAGLHQPSTGTIRVDDLGLHLIDPSTLRSSMGYLGQDAKLFRGTIRENLTMHYGGASDEEILSASRGGWRAPLDYTSCGWI